MTIRAVVALAVLLAPWSGTAAQAAPRPRVCFQGKPLPACRAFLVTETGVAVSVDAATDIYVTWELGLMKNVSARSSVGATLFAASFDPDARFGTKLRYRQWLGRRVHAEIAPGFLWLNDSFGSRSPGLIAHAAVGYGEWIAFTAQVESARYEFRGRETTAFVGLRAGSYVGAVGHAVGIVVLVVTVIAAGNKT